MDANQRIDELERSLKSAFGGSKKSTAASKRGDSGVRQEFAADDSKELAMLRQDGERMKEQIKELNYTLTQKTDSLEVLRRTLGDLRTRYASVVRELNNLKAQPGTTNDPDFSKLTGTPIFLYFTSQQDSIDGARIRAEIAKDTKGTEVYLVNSAARINDLFIKGTRYAKGIYLTGQFVGAIADDFTILQTQVTKMNLGPYKVDKLTSGEFQAITRSKHNTGIVVLLGEQQPRSKQ
jgi:hypothetical protein